MQIFAPNFGVIGLNAKYSTIDNVLYFAKTSTDGKKQIRCFLRQLREQFCNKILLNFHQDEVCELEWGKIGRGHEWSRSFVTIKFNHLLNIKFYRDEMITWPGFLEC